MPQDLISDKFAKVFVISRWWRMVKVVFEQIQHAFVHLCVLGKVCVVAHFFVDKMRNEQLVETFQRWVNEMPLVLP